MDPHKKAIQHAPRRAFTLIELVVVVSIIVILLAMFLPGLDRAIYEAEMSVCRERLGEIGRGTLNYAVMNRSYYPDRQDVARGIRATTNKIVTPPTYDLRPKIKMDMAYETLFQDPLNQHIDLDAVPAPGADAWASYNLFFGWQYTTNGQPVGQGMVKIDDRWEFEGRRYRVIANDFRLIDSTRDQAWASHPDGEGLMSSTISEGFLTPGPATDAANPPAATYFSLWQATPATHGPIDLLAAYDDLTVERLNDVTWDEHDPSSTNFSNRVTGVNAFSEPEPGSIVQIPAR